MEKFIEVYDDLVPLHIQDCLESLLLTKSKKLNVGWVYTPSLTDINNPEISYKEEGFGFTFRGFENDKRLVVSQQHDTLMLPLYSFCQNKNLIPTDILTGRCFLQTPSPYFGAQKPHIDLNHRHAVCLYYVNGGDGDTIFYENDQKTEIKRVSPKKGRIAFFNGSIYHSGSSPAKMTRAVINYNFNYLESL